MLEKKDLNVLNSIIQDTESAKGFFCVVGSVELFPYSIEELQFRFKNKGIIGGKIIDLQTIDEYAIDILMNPLPPVLYFINFTHSPIWETIKIKRDDFIAQQVIVIFFLNPSQYRQLEAQYTSIASLVKNKPYALGAQQTLDDMGGDFRNRIHEVLDRIDKYEKKLDELIQKQPQDSPTDYLLVLRRWNSFSPILSFRPTLSEQEADESLWSQIRREIRGGGYFLRWQKIGIAIDPGHNFIENLYQTKHTVNEIDAIVITHDHLDHTADLEAIIDLLYQYKKRGKAKKISLYLNPTTYLKYKHSLESTDYIERVIPLNVDSKKCHIISKEKGIRLYSTLAQHIELGKAEKAVSLRFQLSTGKKGEVISIGFTSDTGWHAQLEPFFHGVDVLVPHVGSIKTYELEEARFYPTHLGILGLFKILQNIDAAGGTPTVVISEFGEELKGLRDILGEELGQKFPKMKIFPADIGHLVELKPGNIRVLCGYGKNCPSDAESFFEHDGAIQLRCAEHKPTLGKITKLKNSQPTISL
jgi:ribonuclease BN (tRNA processing enzyme)